MECDNLPIGPEIYGEILQGCLYRRLLSQGEQIHARIVKNGAFFYKNEYIETKLLIFYAKCDCLDVAEGLFLRQCKPNVYSWAAMIGLRSRLGVHSKALRGFCDMLEAGEFPDNFVIPNALKASSALRWVFIGKGIHGYAWKMGFASCVYVLSSLVDFYGKCGASADARNVFEEMPERNVVSWNSMLVAYVHNGLDEEALELFYDMRIELVEPTRVSVASILTASANLEAFDEGIQGHAIAILRGLELDNILGSSIINFYCKVGLIGEAEIIFDHMVDRDVVTWNLLVSGYLQDGQIEKALNTCRQMRKQKLKFDSVTLSSITMASAYSRKLELGKAAHGYSIRNGLESDQTVTCSIIDLYASCGRIGHARKVFDTASSRDLVLWNTMISGYAHHGMSGEAFKLFYEMQLEGLPPNVVSWNSIILGFLRNGQVTEAKDMFSQMQLTKVNPNLTTWSTLISGLTQNGCAHETINHYGRMEEVGLRLYPAIIVAVLLACNSLVSLHYGRVIHGQITKLGLLASISVATSLIDMIRVHGWKRHLRVPVVRPISTTQRQRIKLRFHAIHEVRAGAHANCTLPTALFVRSPALPVSSSKLPHPWFNKVSDPS
ncbi:Pentatricopeptide repeat-containing protein, chloroplastic [Ananas comosus]|uniref:Pentatricopeptide repeat-containing protein, chloroplastic n=1 Tax=Ananas comosus TaxID=4615 RepID=A0A199UF09_ANACO|nr:Pentatricopeptide repeat-containing protein, chloroplastic [Ananas comosus]